jgi:hypothetical protein
MSAQSYHRLISDSGTRHNIHSGVSRSCPLQSLQSFFLSPLTLCLTIEAAPLQQPCSLPGRDPNSRLHCQSVQRRRPCSSSCVQTCSCSRLWRQPQTPRYPNFRPCSHLQARVSADFGLLRTALQVLQPVVCTRVNDTHRPLLIRFLHPSSRRCQTCSRNSRGRSSWCSLLVQTSSPG